MEKEEEKDLEELIGSIIDAHPTSTQNTIRVHFKGPLLGGESVVALIASRVFCSIS